MRSPVWTGQFVVPMSIDADVITSNARCYQQEDDYSAGNTKALKMANAFDLSYSRMYDLRLTQKNCDALGCSYFSTQELAESLGCTCRIPCFYQGLHQIDVFDQLMERHG